MSLGSNIVTTLATRVVTLGLALVSSMLLARWLGPEGRGQFALVLLFPELLVTFGVLGFDLANTVYVGSEPEKRRAIVWNSAVTALILGGVITVAIASLLIFSAEMFGKLVAGPLWMYLLLLSIIPVRIVGEFWGALVRGMNYILLLNAVEVGMKMASLVLVVILVAWAGLGVAGAVWGNFILSVAGISVITAILIYLGVWGKPSFDWVLWKRMGKFAFPAYCASAAGFLHYRIDQFIIALFLPPDQLGSYVIAVDLSERLWLLTGAVGNALLPHLTNSPDRDPGLSAVIARHVLIWTGGACLMLFVLADVLIRVMYSSAFVGAVAPLRWLLPGVVLSVVWKIVVTEILARKKVYFITGVTMAATIVNILANLVLVPRMGISGAALGSTISYSLMTFALTWYYLRETGVPRTALVPSWEDLLIYRALWRQKSFLSAVGYIVRS